MSGMYPPRTLYRDCVGPDLRTIAETRVDSTQWDKCVLARAQQSIGKCGLGKPVRGERTKFFPAMSGMRGNRKVIGAAERRAWISG